MTYLLDTNICVFLLRNKFDIASKIASVGVDHCCISEITVAELLYGAECSNHPAENLEMVKELCESIVIVPISDSLETYASKKSELRRNGLLIDDFDLLIGATALYNDFILVTDNVKHFRRLQIKLENWVERKYNDQ